MVKTLFFTWLVVLLVPLGFATDIELSGKYSNLIWAPSRTATTAGYTFTGAEIFWNIQGSMTQDLADGLTFRGGIEDDTILKRRIYAQMGFTMDNLVLQFTPFLGTINSFQKWFNPGLEAAVQYALPGFGFLKGGFLTSFAPISRVGDYYLTSQYVTLGFLMENGIVTFNIVDKSSTFKKDGGKLIADGCTRYWLDTEMFLKNFPLRPAILIGAQVLNRSYIEESTETPLWSVLLGTRLVYSFGPAFSLFAEAETSLFNIGLLDTKVNIGETTPVFQLQAGARYHF